MGKEFKNYDFSEIENIKDSLILERSQLRNEKHALYRANPKPKSNEDIKNINERISAINNEINYINNILKDRCGYWNVCEEHGFACSCSPSALVSQGFNNEVYNSMMKSMYV